MTLNIALPNYADVLAGLAGAVTNNGAAKAPFTAVEASKLTAADMPERRSEHVKASGALALRRNSDKASRGHQLRCAGLTSSELATLPSLPLFQATGSFWPQASDLAGLCKGRGDDLVDATVCGVPLLTNRKYVATLAAATFYLDDLIGRMIKHDVQQPADVPFVFSADLLWRKQSKTLSANLRQVESTLGGIVKLLETDAAIARHSKTDVLTVNAAWRPALRQSYIARFDNVQ